MRKHKNKRKNRIINKVLIILLLIIIFTILLLYFYSKKVTPTVMKYAKINSKKIGIDIISNKVSDSVIKLLEQEDIFFIDKDNNGNIESIDYNPKVVNEILSITSKVVLNNFEKMEKENEGVVTKVPIGIVTDNLFLENLGPKVPVRLNLNGNVMTSLKTEVKEYGINSALIKVSVKIEANVYVIIPLKMSEMTIVNEVPISIKIVEGNVSSILNSN